MSTTNMRDVAKHAGVSIATVSHVINNTRYVKEETRKKVMESIKALDYSPNALARSFKTGRRNLIAFIVPDIASPFFSTMIEEVEAVITPKGYHLLICNTKERRDQEADTLRILANGMVDGFIIASTFASYDPISKMLPTNTPIVFVDRSLENCPCDTLLIDNYQAIRTGTDLLIRQGHSRIAFISGTFDLSTTCERKTAYEDAMTAHGLSTEGLIYLANPLNRYFSENLASILQNDITAILAPNAAITTEVLALLVEFGYVPGKDIELIGYKESDQPQYIAPNIHLVSQPSEALGRAAGQQILERLDHPDMSVRRTILTATFTPHK